MPKNWLYYFALILPLGLRVMVLPPVTNWLWYHGYGAPYYLFSGLSVQPNFLALIGGWPFPVFIVTVIIHWMTDENEKELSHQFLLLPLAYVPFAIIGTILVTRAFDQATLYSYPLVIIFCGYCYVLIWWLLIWVLQKAKIVV